MPTGRDQGYVDEADRKEDDVDAPPPGTDNTYQKTDSRAITLPNIEAYKAFLIIMLEEVTRFLYGRLVDREIVEDALQNIALKGLTYPPKNGPPYSQSHVRSLVWVMAHQEVADEFRRRQRQGYPVSLDDSEEVLRLPDSGSDFTDSDGLYVNDLVGRLKPNHAKVLTLRAGGHSIKSIAAKLGENQATIGTWIWRAKRECHATDQALRQRAEGNLRRYHLDRSDRKAKV